MNQVVIIGRITAKPRFVRIDERKCYLNFFMRFVGHLKEHVDIQVTLSNNLARKLNNKLKEGYVVKVTGQLAKDTWQDKNGHHDRMKIFADQIAPYK